MNAIAVQHTIENAIERDRYHTTRTTHDERDRTQHTIKHATSMTAPHDTTEHATKRDRTTRHDRTRDGE